MVELIHAIILSIVQGISEWFPISSSGHLAIVQEIFGFQNLAYDVFLHFASILAVVFIFRKDIILILKLDKKSLIYIRNLVIALIPAGLIGILFRNEIEQIFSNMVFLGVFFIFSGFVIYSSKYSLEKKSKISFLDSLFIGLFQSLAVFPGVSRSGMTISSGLFRNLKKETTIKFSFLLAIPLILGASVFEFNNLVLQEINYLVLSVSFVLTFLVSFITIKTIIKIIQKEKFYLFGIYNVLLGILILIVSL
jgi:undecaprenyl-diphosphatase